MKLEDYQRIIGEYDKELASLRKALDEAREVIDCAIPYIVGRLPSDAFNREKARHWLEAHPKEQP